MTITPETVRSVADWMQVTVLIVSVVLLILILAVGTRWPGTRPFLVLLLTYAGHSVLFYIFALANVLPPPYGNLWSAVLRLHAQVTFLSAVVVVTIVLMSPDGVHYYQSPDEGTGDE